MISLILPYWQRQLATDTALARMARAYPSLKMEVIIVDDGSPMPFVMWDDYPWPVRIFRLERKDVPKSPCVPLNRGVAAANGEFIALSNPETLHSKPVLQAMMHAITDSLDYVLAACWAPESNKWHAHSSIAGNTRDGVAMPPNSCFHFLSVMKRRLWEACGGFDEDYREGHGYEDTDFVKRLERAGANFIMRDDLVVEHPRKGAKSDWQPAKIERNRRLFKEKWRGR